MNAILRDLDFAVAELDILIKSRNREEHAKHVILVILKIKEYGFKLSIDKCNFLTIKYLGHIDEKGRKPDPAKAKAIKKQQTMCLYQQTY